jgi:hypothetical protein
MTVLYHGTDEKGAVGIKARGFGLSHLADSARMSWFSEEPDECTKLAGRQPEWLVVVELPDDVAERHRYRFEDGTPYLGNYLIPWDIVNEYRSTFRFQGP